MTGYDAKTMAFRCKECGDKYVQSKAFPYDYIEHGNEIESPKFEPLEIGVCPDCDSRSSKTTHSDAKSISFRCEKCGNRFTQSLAFPYDYLEPEAGQESTQSEAYPHNYTEPRDRRESYGKPRTNRHFPIKKVIGGLVAIVVVIALLGGFAYSYINKLNEFNQTKSDLESLGYTISNNVDGIDISAFIKSASPVVPMVDLASFISVARQYNSTTIYESGYSFYVIIVTLMILVSAYEYTPNNSIWWIW
jgi:ribosomal protein L37AE/L43A